MGSGKTTVGRILASRLGWHFADLDQHVEAREGRSVPQIFAEQGEDAFRRAETAVLAHLLVHPELVIALGGGAAGTPSVRELLASTPALAVVHLDAPFPVLYERCTAQALDPHTTERPLLGAPEAAAARYGQRRGLYQSVAHVTVSADAGAPETIAELILDQLAID